MPVSVQSFSHSNIGSQNFKCENPYNSQEWSLYQSIAGLTGQYKSNFPSIVFRLHSHHMLSRNWQQLQLHLVAQKL